ncbi:MAG: SRPBCC family protein [Candidatus Rokuibacteriota bacterium]
MPDILHQLTIRARPAEVFRALTSTEGLSAWWTRDALAEPAIGSVAQFGFNRREVVFRMFVQDLEKDVQVRWRCLGGHPDWKDTEITFALSAVADGTVLRFAHRGWKSSEGTFAVCSFDWARYLTSLRTYLETGRGVPHPG